MAESADRSLRWYATREPVVVLVLTATAIVSFLAVSLLATVFQARQTSEADKWFRRATTNQKKGYLNQSPGEYRTAILYDRDNFGYRLGLAQTYAALGRMNEAFAYLVPLHERQQTSSWYALNPPAGTP